MKKFCLVFFVVVLCCVTSSWSCETFDVLNVGSNPILYDASRQDVIDSLLKGYKNTLVVSFHYLGYSGGLFMWNGQLMNVTGLSRDSITSCLANVVLDFDIDYRGSIPLTYGCGSNDNPCGGGVSGGVDTTESYDIFEWFVCGLICGSLFSWGVFFSKGV
jgi:hypothetical protein